MKVHLGLYQLDIFNIPSWVSFEHFHASFRKYQSGMPYTLGKNISEFVLVNSRFQIDYIVYISLKSSEKSATGNFVMFMSLHWYCHRGLGCGKMIKFTFTFSVTCTHATGPSHFVNAMQVHTSLWVVKYITQVPDPFRSPPLWSPNDMIVTDICQYSMCPI